MPETNGNANSLSQNTKKRNEQTEAKFFEYVNQLIAEVGQTPRLLQSQEFS